MRDLQRRRIQDRDSSHVSTEKEKQITKADRAFPRGGNRDSK